LVAGHPACLASDAAVHTALLDDGIDLRVVQPDRQGRLGGGMSPVRWVRQLAPDVVLVDEPRVLRARQWVLAATRAQVPVVLGIDDPSGDPGWAARRLWRQTLRRASALAARTPGAARAARDHGVRGPVVLVPRPVATSGAAAIDADAGADRPFTVGYVGELAESEGVPTLLSAIDRLPRETRLLVAGDGPMRTDVQRHRKVELHVSVPADGLAALMAEMDVLVLTSPDPAGWPGRLGAPVAFEAMAVGTPVVAATSGRTPWVVSEGVCGMTYPVDDVVALAGLLADAHADPVRWQAAGELGRAHVDERCSPATASTAVTELAERLVARRAQRI
jgi:glycosyltransferase involved in cell wall biosynthesis